MAPAVTRPLIAAEELAELVAVEAKIKKATAELKAIVLARGSHLMDLHGVGPVVAARVLAEAGQVQVHAIRSHLLGAVRYESQAKHRPLAGQECAAHPLYDGPAQQAAPKLGTRAGLATSNVVATRRIGMRPRYG